MSLLLIIFLIYCCIVPNDNSTSSLFIADLNPVHMMVVMDIILTCSAKYPYSSFIDIDTNVNIQWLNSSNHTLHSYTGLNDYTEHTLNYTISNVKLSDAGQYSCAFFIDSAINHSYILASDTTISSINISISKYYTLFFTLSLPLVSDNVQPPINIQLVAINSSALILSWDTSTQQSIPIIGYNYTCIGINVSYTVTGSVSDTTFSVTLLELIPFSEYTCNVSAITSNGIGTSSNVNAITKESGMNCIII